MARNPYALTCGVLYPILKESNVNPFVAGVTVPLCGLPAFDEVAFGSKENSGAFGL